MVQKNVLGSDDVLEITLEQVSVIFFMTIRPWGVAASENIKLPVHADLVGISIIGKLHKQIIQTI